MHLCEDLRIRHRQEVRRPHSHLQRAERVLHRLVALAHCLRVLVETPLCCLQHMLMLPARDTLGIPVEGHRDKVATYDHVVVDELQDFNQLEVSLIDLLC